MNPSPSRRRTRAMKTYNGTRCNGVALVRVDGRPLPPRFDLRNHSPTGFEWGYEGSGPAQLALAILCDHLSMAAKAQDLHYDTDLEAEDLYHDFKRLVIANLPAGEWTLTTADIDRALAEIRAIRAAGGELSPEEVPY